MSDGSGTSRPYSVLAPLRQSIFRQVWVANLASRFGGLVQTVGASWLMISLDGSATLVTLVQTSTTLPIFLFALVAGALADTVDRRRLMLVAQVVMLATSTALSIFALLGLLNPWLLLLFTFLIGVGSALNGPAWQASVGDMVPRAELPAAVALNSLGFNIARSTGPPVGGVIVAAAGATAAFAVNAVSYLALIVVLLKWRPPSRKVGREREALGRAVMTGLRYAALSPEMPSVLARSVVFGIGAGAIPALMPLVARDLVAGGPATFGLLLGAFGGGAVAGASVAGALRRRISTEGFVRLSTAALAGAAVATAFSGSTTFTMAALFVGGGGWVVELSTFNVTVQMGTPRWVVGRALSLQQTMAFGGMALGSSVWGLITEWAGLQSAMLGSACVSLVCLAMSLRHPLAALNEPDKMSFGIASKRPLACPTN